jgi:UDP-2,3-diacylglucosamine hydrolase
MESRKIYFASDFHFGIPNHKESRIREEKFIRWLNEIKTDAKELYLLGDMFDFWFEYDKVIPKGFVRLLGKLAELKDLGIEIHFFKGNHDLWMFGYFQEELGIKVYNEPIIKEYNGLKFFIGHGDGLGPGDYSYKALKVIFTNRFCQWLFSLIHPDIGISLALLWSRLSRRKNERKKMNEYKGNNKEYLFNFCKDRLSKEHFDYFILGHRHLMLNIELNEKSRYINLGDWISLFSYAVFDGKNITQYQYEH